ETSTSIRPPTRRPAARRALHPHLGRAAYGGNTAVNTGFFNLKLGTIQQESNWPAVINGTSNTLASSQISDSTGWAIKSILGWDGQILDWTGMKFLPVLDLGVFSSADNVTLADQANGTKSVTASSTLNQGQFSLLGDLLKLKWGEGERTATATGVAGTATATTAPLSDITVSTIFGLGATIKPGATWDLSKLGLIGQAASVLAHLSLGLPGQNKTVVADDGTHAEAHQTGLGITAGLKIAANTGQLLSFSATLGSQDVEAQAPEGGIVLPGAECNTQYFSDVTPDMQFFNDICWLKEKGITTGWPDGTFRPVTPVARDAMAAFLYRQAGSPDVTLPKDPSFTDVPADNMFYKEIEWMQAKGIAAGWDDGTYRPLNDTNRDAMAAFIHRAVNQGIITLK
ncbi:S-layer homology domain-containing protein, partial [Propionibacterium freudenreichii]